MNTPRPIPPGALDQASVPPAADRDRQRLRHLAWWQTANLTVGLLLCTVGYVVVSALHFNRVESAEAVARHMERPVEQLYDPAPGTFWLGIALIAISELQAIQVAIRETHLQL